jgi:DNA-binding response OmpR family regulator
LVIINQPVSEAEGTSFMQSLRACLGRTDVPVMLLADGVDEQMPLSDGLAAATDYLAKPLCLPMLRTRVRVWLGRTLTCPPRQEHGQARRAAHS